MNELEHTHKHSPIFIPLHSSSLRKGSQRKVERGAMSVRLSVTVFHPS